MHGRAEQCRWTYFGLYLSDSNEIDRHRSIFLVCSMLDVAESIRYLHLQGKLP